jgi:hypothetical protein
MCAIEMEAYDNCMVEASIEFISCAMQQCEWHSWNTLYAILNIYIYIYSCVPKLSYSLCLITLKYKKKIRI